MEDGRNEGRTERVHDLEEENGEQEGFAERNKGESIKGGREGGELKERTFWRGGRKERERLPRRRVCSFGYGIAGGYAR